MPKIFSDPLISRPKFRVGALMERNYQFITSKGPFPVKPGFLFLHNTRAPAAAQQGDYDFHNVYCSARLSHEVKYYYNFAGHRQVIKIITRRRSQNIFRARAAHRARLYTHGFYERLRAHNIKAGKRARTTAGLIWILSERKRDDVKLY